MRADPRTIVDLGPVHMNGRIYDPLLGRFLSADLIVQAPGNLQDFNRYSYVRNNPLSLTDPSGWECAPPMFVQTMQAAFVMGHGKEYMDAQAKSANAGAEAVGLAGIGVIPVVGDVVGLKMDIDDLTSPTTALWEKGLAVLDIGLTLSTASVAPNIGPESRAVGVIVDEVKSLEKGTNAAAKAASDVTTTAAKKVDTTPTPEVQTAAPTTPAPTETGNLNSVEAPSSQVADAAKSAQAAKVGADAPHSQPKRDLVEMAKTDKTTGVTREDMKAYEDLNKELPDPFPPNRVRVDEGHPGRSPHAEKPHGHVGPVDYIPIKNP